MRRRMGEKWRRRRKRNTEEEGFADLFLSFPEEGVKLIFLLPLLPLSKKKEKKAGLALSPNPPSHLSYAPAPPSSYDVDNCFSLSTFRPHVVLRKLPRCEKGAADRIREGCDFRGRAQMD